MNILEINTKLEISPQRNRRFKEKQNEKFLKENSVPLIKKFRGWMRKLRPDDREKSQ